MRKSLGIVSIGLLLFSASCQESAKKTDVPQQAETASDANDFQAQLFQHRAMEAINWAMPAVNFERMRQAMLQIPNGRENQIVYWSGLSDWKNQLLTPNTDLIYLLPFYDTKEVGPIVVEIPPAEGGIINGTLMDAWQNPLEDLGPAGVDQGKGGKYLVLPPGYDKPVPPWYIALQSLTYKGYGLIRSILKSGSEEDIAKAIAYGKCIKLYPLSQAGKQPETVYTDAKGIIFDATIRYDNTFFTHLDRFVQYEPWLQRDRAMIDVLKTIGISKGKEFEPTQDTLAKLDQAAKLSQQLLDLGFEKRFSPPWHESSHWAFLTTPAFVRAAQSGYEDPNYYPIDDRGVLYTFIFFAPKRLSEGQFYLMTVKDKDGNAVEGNKTYTLHVPPNVPVRHYWSVTLYDRVTHALIRDVSHAAISSQKPDLQTNADGSVDLYFGPKPVQGKESNWIPTNPKDRFEVLFRFYGNEPRLFEKTWLLPDVVEYMP